MAAAEHVKDIMTTGAISVDTSDPLSKAVKLMTEKNISCVMVVEKEKLQGIITERDLVQRVLYEKKDVSKLKAKDIMTKNLTSISREATLEEGMRIIESMKVRRLPVVDENGLVGLITQTDIVDQTYNIHRDNKKLSFHQQIQSYVIVATAIFVVAVFMYKFVF